MGTQSDQAKIKKDLIVQLGIVLVGMITIYFSITWKCILRPTPLAPDPAPGWLVTPSLACDQEGVICPWIYSQCFSTLHLAGV